MTIIRDDGNSGPLYAGELCGTLGESAIVVSNLPVSPFEVGDSVVVQARLRGEAIGFTATVLAVLQDPVPYYLLSFPESWEALELRRAPRVPTLIPVRVAAVDPGKPEMGRGEILNLSAGGCALYLPDHCPARTRLRVWINLPGEHADLVLDLTVIDRREDPDTTVYGARFEHNGEGEASINLIGAWVAQRSVCRRTAAKA